MAIKEILLLGNPRLHEPSRPVTREERSCLPPIMGDLRDTLLDFRSRSGAGRAIAAPQIGIPLRLVYMEIDQPLIFVNPHLEMAGNETMEVWDDCLSFPDLVVRVERHRHCRVRYLDMEWEERELDAVGDLSELLQHECDHLDGILATSRAIDGRSFALKGQVSDLDP